MATQVSNQEHDEEQQAGDEGEQNESVAGQRNTQRDSPPAAPQKAPAPESAQGDVAAGMYNPADYADLRVSPEIKELFDFILRYKPQDVELETKLKPFIPDYIPSVGDIDAFIKIPPPDGSEDGLGLKVLDEPSGTQSDPSVLEIQLNMTSKSEGKKPVTVRTIDNADKNPKKITNWIQNIEEIHRKKPPPNVIYSHTMPHINKLMKAWPEEFESKLLDLPLPTAQLNMNVNQFSRLTCALLDVPVYDKVVESLHVVFSLYSEFQNNVHFNP